MLKIFNWRYIIILCVIGVLLFGLIQYLKANPLLEVSATSNHSQCFDNGYVRDSVKPIILPQNLKKVVINYDNAVVIFR